MMVLYIVSAQGDTSQISREEVGKFIASQCILGCVAYPAATALFVGTWTEDANLTACTALMTPLACLTASGIYALSNPLKKPMAVASFTGAIDGSLWSSLVYLNIMAWSDFGDYDVKVFSTMILGGLASGNLAGLYAGYLGGSEGSYILKTYAAFHVPYAYFQGKRLIFGNFLSRYSETEGKIDLLLATALSIGGGLGTYNLTRNDYSISGGDALFIGSNVIKAAMILDLPIRLVYINSKPDANLSPLFTGAFVYYDDPVYDRLSAAAYLTGMALGAYISYNISKKKDLNLLEGLTYSIVPILAYYAAMGPLLLSPDFYRIMPIFQVSFDVGTSYLLYQLFEKI